MEFKSRTRNHGYIEIHMRRPGEDEASIVSRHSAPSEAASTAYQALADNPGAEVFGRLERVTDYWLERDGVGVSFNDQSMDEATDWDRSVSGLIDSTDAELSIKIAEAK